MHIASERHFHGLRGSSGLQMTSEATSEVRFEPSNLKLPVIHMHIASESHFHGLWSCSGLQMTSKVKADLKIELSDINYLWSHASLACKGFLEMIPTTNKGQLWSIDLRASPQVKTSSNCWSYRVFRIKLDKSSCRLNDYYFLFCCVSFSLAVPKHMSNH